MLNFNHTNGVERLSKKFNLREVASYQFKGSRLEVKSAAAPPHTVCCQSVVDDPKVLLFGNVNINGTLNFLPNYLS